MKKLLIILLILLINCGSVNKNKEVSKLETAKKKELKTETDFESKSESNEELTSRLASNVLGFGIEPINGIPAVFSFSYNGQKIEGETTGKLNFNKEQKTQELTQKRTEKVQTIYKTETTYKTQTTYKSEYKKKDVERETTLMSWIVMWSGWIILLLVVLIWLWQKYGRNWVLNWIFKI